MNASARVALRKIISEEGSQSAAARRLSISPQYMTDLMRGRRQPGAKLLRRLGLRRVVNYEEVPQ